MSKINVKIVIQDDAPAVMEHLGEFFCLDEPILRSLKLTPNAKFLSMCCDMINDNISLKAVDDQGNIIGLLLSEIKRRIVDDNDVASEVNDDDGGMHMVYAMLKFMDKSANIFERYPDIDQYVDGAILSVNSAYRSCGIGSKLFDRLIELCRERDLFILKVFASSIFTAKICEKMGMTNIFGIAYSDAKLDNMPAFNIAEPHTHAFDYCLDLRNLTR